MFFHFTGIMLKKLPKEYVGHVEGLFDSMTKVIEEAYGNWSELE
jgi:hypothetical protein